MKIKIPLFALVYISLFSCNKSPQVEAENNSEEIHQESISINMESKEYDLSMYNDKYVLQIVPEKKDNKNDILFDVILLKDMDTIIQQVINIDIIDNRYYEIDKRGLENGRIDFKNDYYITGIEYKSVRTNSLYLNAILKTKNKSEQMKVMLKFKYMGKDTGKFYCNVL